MTLGAIIRKRREELGLSQAELGARVGYPGGPAISRQAVGYWERGESFPEIERLPLIARALNLQIAALVHGTARAPSAGEPTPLYDPAHGGRPEQAQLPHFDWATLRDALANEDRRVLDPPLGVAEAATMEVPVGWYAPGRFLVRVTGDAMDDGSRDAIPDGTDVLFDARAAPQHGDRVLVKLPDGGLLFRRYDATAEGVHLTATNPDHPERILAMPAGAEVIAVALRVTRELKRS